MTKCPIEEEVGDWNGRPIVIGALIQSGVEPPHSKVRGFMGG